MLLAWILGFSLVGSVGAIVGAAGLLAFPRGVRKRLVPALVSYATGTLLGAAFLGMIPKSLEALPASTALGTVLAGIVGFFLLEKYLLWRHCHEAECEAHGRAGPLLLVGDAFHNFVDGVVVAAAFLTSIPLGVATAIAVVAHELPQELGDFAVLLDSGYARREAFLLNLASSLATLPGALLGYFFLDAARGWIPYILAVSAASFIYIATADLVPGLHKRTDWRSGLIQAALMLAGIGTIMLLRLGH